MINAIVLAAGESRRMGRPKPLLRFGDRTFLGQIVAVLRSSHVDRITVVLGARAEAIKEAIDLSQTDVVINTDYRKGQLSSLIAGLKNIDRRTEAIVLCLVDNPFITAELVDQVIHAYRETKAAIVVPTFDGRRGHPALFSSLMFEALLHAPPQEGARHVVYSNEDKVVEIAVAESAVLVGIDTPEDYRSHFGADP